MIRFFSRPRRERGAVAIMVAALAVVLFGVAALGVDIASQVNRKHLLKNQLDAAATAAAYYLDVDTTGIKDAATKAQEYFAKNGKGTLDPSKIDFWCVVARKLNTDNTPATPAQVASYQIPSASQTAGVCNPDAASASTDWKQSDYQNRVRYDGTSFKMSCSATLCAVPCALQAQPSNNWAPGSSIANSRPITCNTVRIGAEQGVPFSFAPVLGIDEGSTGSQIATACKGTCGSVAPNPMNVVVVTDRTYSMIQSNGGNGKDEDAMIEGIRSMLLKMSPSQQYVALGTIGRSNSSNRSSFTSCSTVSIPSATKDARANVTVTPDSTSTTKYWVPLQFYNNYQNGSVLNGSSNLIAALKCLEPSAYGGSASTSSNTTYTYGTNLASPMKAAARYVTGLDANNISALGSRSGNVRNVIIFETDGQPYEYYDSSSDPTQNKCGVTNSLTTKDATCGNGYDVFSDYMHVSKSGTATGTAGTTFTTQSSGVAYNDTKWSSTYKPSVTPTNCYRSTGMSNSCSSGTYYKITYNISTNARTDTQYYERDGGEGACANLQAVADAFKAYDANDLVITIGYNLNSATLCGGNNATPPSLPSPPSGSTTYNGAAWIQAISPTSGSWSSNTSGQRKTDCIADTSKSGASAAQALSIKTSTCQLPLTVTYAVGTSISWVNSVTDTGANPTVNSVLAAASGGQGIDAAGVDSGGCSTDASGKSENADADYFFCAASGDDMGSIFVTALSQVSTGIKLINLPSGG